MTANEFVANLLMYFSKRHDSDSAENAWLADITKRFDHCDKAVLEKAFELIVSEHDERAFPLPAALNKWIARASEMVYPDQHASEHDKAAAGYAKRLSDATKRIKGTATGQRAAREGWVLSLRDFVADNGRMPDERQIGQLIENSRFVDRFAAGAEGRVMVGGLDITDHYKKLAMSFIERREKIAQYMLAGDHSHE